MKLTPENYKDEISMQAYKDTSFIVDRMPAKTKDQLAYNVICFYIEAAYLKGVPFLKCDKELEKQLEFLGFLIRLAGIDLDVITASSFLNAKPDHP